MGLFAARTTTGVRPFPALFAVPLFAVLTTPGCPASRGAAPRTGETRPTAGVTIRLERHGAASVRLIDVELAHPRVRVEVAADEIALRQGRVTGRARTVPEWLEATGAVAGINGGFFGKSVSDDHKEIVGLLKREGRVRAAAPSYHSQRTGGRYSRSAIGFTETGSPRMAWVTSRPGDPQTLRSHPAPDFSGGGTPWTVQQALACGPRLIRSGKTEITYRGERLASPGALPRTFLGYGGSGKARRLVLCATDAMEFEDCARFLHDYFKRRHGVPCDEAMALDGGASTQASWREGSRVKSDFSYATTVPTAILVHVRR